MGKFQMNQKVGLIPLINTCSIPEAENSSYNGIIVYLHVKYHAWTHHFNEIWNFTGMKVAGERASERAGVCTFAYANLLQNNIIMPFSSSIIYHSNDVHCQITRNKFECTRIDTHAHMHEYKKALAHINVSLSLSLSLLLYLSLSLFFSFMLK